MEHRGIEYTIHARPGRNEWSWTIYPKNAPVVKGDVSGIRELAIAAARRAIDRWLEKHPPPK